MPSTRSPAHRRSPCMPNPHGLRCALQARCNSRLVSRGDVPVGPVGPGAPPSPPPSPTVRSAARPAIFFLVSKPSNSCNQFFFRSRNKHQNRSGFARPYLAPALRCGKERPSDCRGAVQQLPAESWEAIRSVKASHGRNTWLTLFPTAGERGLRGTRAGQWTPPV